MHPYLKQIYSSLDFCLIEATSFGKLLRAEASLNHISIRANANCNFKTQTAIFKSGALLVLLVSKQASF